MRISFLSCLSGPTLLYSMWTFYIICVCSLLCYQIIFCNKNDNFLLTVKKFNISCIYFMISMICGVILDRKKEKSHIQTKDFQIGCTCVFLLFISCLLWEAFYQLKCTFVRCTLTESGCEWRPSVCPQNMARGCMNKRRVPLCILNVPLLSSTSLFHKFMWLSAVPEDVHQSLEIDSPLHSLLHWHFTDTLLRVRIWGNSNLQD